MHRLVLTHLDSDQGTDRKEDPALSLQEQSVFYYFRQSFKEVIYSRIEYITSLQSLLQVSSDICVRDLPVFTQHLCTKH